MRILAEYAIRTLRQIYTALITTHRQMRVRCTDPLLLSVTLLLLEDVQLKITNLLKTFSRLTTTPFSTNREYLRTRWNKLKEVSLKLEDASRRSSVTRTPYRNTLSIMLIKTRTATSQ
jgi:hypothetical protein